MAIINRIALCLIISITFMSCASKQLPLPASIDIEAPSSDMPPELSAFLGISVVSSVVSVVSGLHILQKQCLSVVSNLYN